jgi:hypothetical protein
LVVEGSLRINGSPGAETRLVLVEEDDGDGGLVDALLSIFLFF